jgi:hypothetical protein
MYFLKEVNFKLGLNLKVFMIFYKESDYVFISRSRTRNEYICKSIVFVFIGSIKRSISKVDDYLQKSDFVFLGLLRNEDIKLSPVWV